MHRKLWMPIILQPRLNARQVPFQPPSGDAAPR